MAVHDDLQIDRASRLSFEDKYNHIRLIKSVLLMTSNNVVDMLLL